MFMRQNMMKMIAIYILIMIAVLAISYKSLFTPSHDRLNNTHRVENKCSDAIYVISNLSKTEQMRKYNNAHPNTHAHYKNNNPNIENEIQMCFEITNLTPR